MRSSDDANVDLDRSRTPDSFEFPLLQDPQECDLRVGRKVADFIQEDGAAIRQFEAPEAPLHRSGEGPFLMAEQFGGDQTRRQCTAVHTDEGAARSLRSLVDGAGDQFLARPRLACDQYAGVCGSHLANPRQNSLQRLRGTNDFLKHGCAIHFVPQRQVFPLESILERPDLGFALLELTIKAGSLE